MQVPRAVHLRSPVALDQLVGDVRQRRVLDHRGAVQHTAQRLAGRLSGGDQTRGGIGGRDVTQHHLDLGALGTNRLDGLTGVPVRLRTGVEDDASAAARC